MLKFCMCLLLPHNQNGIRKAEARHNEALSELKRVHREELEDIQRRNADSKSLEALAGQVNRRLTPSPQCLVSRADFTPRE